jgi:glycosyltransferase involved in cell wall biosynthesis
MIGTRGVPAHYGGFETAIEEIGSRLAAGGDEVVVFCRPVQGEDAQADYRGMRLVHLPALRKRSLETLSHTALSVVSPALTGVDAAVLFNAANAPFLPVLRARGIPVATHVDGLEWRRSKWGPAGRRYYRFAESLAVRWSDALIADAAGIADYYRAEFDAPTRLISYGAPSPVSGSDRLAELGLTPQGYHLVVARFEPENHVLEIVRGYVSGHSSVPLVVVGSAPYSDDYSARIQAAADERVRLLGGVWDQDLLDQLYVNAASYLHGHSVGGTNPSLLRAVGAGTPTIAYDCAFNREVLAETGWYFSEPDSVRDRIEEVDSDPGERARRAAALPDVAKRYDWDVVAAEYRELCRDLSAGVRAPRRSGRRSTQRPQSVDPRAGRPILVAHPSPDLYGSDRVLLESVSAFVDAGTPVVATLPAAGPLAEALAERGAEVVYCPTPVLRKSALRPVGLVRLVGEALASLGPSLGLLRAKEPAAVYVNTLTIPWWMLLGKLTRRRVVCHVHEAEQSAPVMVRRALYSPLVLADRILVNSRFSENVIVSTWPLLRRRTRLVYNGVPGPDTATEPREQLDRVRLLFVGRLSPRKGPQVAVSGLARLVGQGLDAELSLLGAVFPGYEWFERELRELVDQLGMTDRVTFIGFDPDVWRHLSDCDIVLVPSTVDEPFGNTAVEAMLAQRPLVVSRTSGLQEAAEGYATARFVDPGDEIALADAVQDLVRSWPTVREQVEADRELALQRHSTQAYREQVAGLVGEGTGRPSSVTPERKS